MLDNQKVINISFLLICSTVDKIFSTNPKKIHSFLNKLCSNKKLSFYHHPVHHFINHKIIRCQSFFNIKCTITILTTSLTTKVQSNNLLF